MFPKCRTSDSKLLFVKSDTAQTSASVCAPFVRFIHHTNRSRDSGAAPCRSLREILMLLLQTSFSLWNDQTSIPQLRLLPFQSTDSLQKSCFATVQQSTLPPAPILQNHLRSTSSLRRSALFLMFLHCCTGLSRVVRTSYSQKWSQHFSESWQTAEKKELSAEDNTDLNSAKTGGITL